MKKYLLLTLMLVLCFTAYSSDYETSTKDAKKSRLETPSATIDYEAFIKAAQNGDKAAVKRFIKSGVDVNYEHYHGYTALIFAAENGHKEIVNMLLKAGAKPDIQDDYKKTALSYAAHNGHKEIVNMLKAASKK